MTIRQFLDGPALTYIPHIVLRGTYVRDTVRCTSGGPNRVPAYARPGYFQHSILINCYADVRVNGYILGNGPARLTVLVTYHHYWHGYYAEWAAEENITEQEVVEQIRAAHVTILEKGFKLTGEGIHGREVILFVGPGHSHGHEVWEVIETWYVQRREDGTVIAAHPHRDDWRGARPDKYREHLSRLEVELPRFEKEVLAAHQARVTEYGGRIASADIQGIAEGVTLPLLVSDIHSLGTFMASTGAYDHPDGAPAKPPPVPGEGDPVPDIRVDDSTPGAQPTPPGGVEDSTPTPTPTPTAADVSENRAPSFGSSSYSFSVAEDAATSTSVGATSATDPDSGDTVSYSITAGNEDANFAVNGVTGEITVVGALDYETTSSYTLTVEASDGNGGAATTTVAITVTDVAEGT